MKEFKFTINGNDYSVEVHGVEGTHASLEVNGTPYEVEIQRKTQASKTPTIVRSAIKAEITPEIAKKEGGSAHPILAPLPGSIMNLAVQKGDIVKKGDLLLIMEAMKMENKVLADRAGVLEKVLVSSGDNVLQGDILMEIV